jgi:hypothetical protein
MASSWILLRVSISQESTIVISVIVARSHNEPIMLYCTVCWARDIDSKENDFRQLFCEPRNSTNRASRFWTGIDDGMCEHEAGANQTEFKTTGSTYKSQPNESPYIARPFTIPPHEQQLVCSLRPVSHYCILPNAHSTTPLLPAHHDIRYLLP